jgi:hypothetical protein
MRVACTSTPEGHVYRFYRTEQDVTAALRPIVPILLASQVDIVVGQASDDPALLMQVGPIGGEAETTLLDLIERHLTVRCASGPRPASPRNPDSMNLQAGDRTIS